MDYLQADDNLVLERLKHTHAVIIYDCISQNRLFLRKWLPFIDQTRSLSDTESYVRMILSPPEKERNQVFVIWHHREFAGLAGYKVIDTINHKTEIGYWMAEKMQGRGIMTRTVSKMIDYGFRNLGMNRIQIKVATGNVKSSAIPKRLGFSFEGVERAGEFHSQSYLDLEIYSILKREWAERLA